MSTPEKHTVLAVCPPGAARQRLYDLCLKELERTEGGVVLPLYMQLDVDAEMMKRLAPTVLVALGTDAAMALLPRLEAGWPPSVKALVLVGVEAPRSSAVWFCKNCHRCMSEADAARIFCPSCQVHVKVELGFALGVFKTYRRLAEIAGSGEKCSTCAGAGIVTTAGKATRCSCWRGGVGGVVYPREVIVASSGEDGAFRAGEEPRTLPSGVVAESITGVHIGDINYATAEAGMFGLQTRWYREVSDLETKGVSWAIRTALRPEAA